ncbi:MAG: SpaH/EbpB family LPXTG-anchored major pilin, partial [Oscillospiraceae bacterium]|nr:SpaH/EbpB family LPXTG-anchored major pilin [Oscillospiraceae bacterium]
FNDETQTISTASITVTNAVENDVLAAYKVVDINYNAATNDLTYAWNSYFANYFAGTTIEQFSNLTDDSKDLKALLAGLPEYINVNNIAPVQSKKSVNKVVTFEDLAIGEYFILPTTSTSVYQLMLQKLEPTVTNNTYMIDDSTFTAKHEEVTISKAADKTSVTKGENVNYTVTVDIPTYGADAADKSFSVSDLLPDGLTLNISSIKVQIDGADVDKSTYTLDTTETAGYTFKISVSNDNYSSWSANAGKQLIITYTAQLNRDDTTAVNVKETNTATFDYSYYPYVANSHKTQSDTANVTTFAIQIDKYQENDDTKKLEGAVFDLYRTAYSGETRTVTIPLTSKEGILLESGLETDENGSALFAKYEANGSKYDYYLVETKAPSGYNILGEAIKINFSDKDVAATNGIFTVKVPNSSGIQLPITGGTGTVVFSVIGIILMIAAVAMLVIYKKRARNKKAQ